ncbi:hypothetical protein ACOMHN_055919 [Nucella lapillus]
MPVMGRTQTSADVLMDGHLTSSTFRAKFWRDTENADLSLDRPSGNDLFTGCGTDPLVVCFITQTVLQFTLFHSQTVAPGDLYRSVWTASWTHTASSSHCPGPVVPIALGFFGDLLHFLAILCWWHLDADPDPKQPAGTWQLQHTALVTRGQISCTPQVTAISTHISPQSPPTWVTVTAGLLQQGQGYSASTRLLSEVKAIAVKTTAVRSRLQGMCCSQVKATECVLQ